MPVAVFVIVMPSGHVDSYQRFGGAHHLHLQGDNPEDHSWHLFSNLSDSYIRNHPYRLQSMLGVVSLVILEPVSD